MKVWQIKTESLYYMLCESYDLLQTNPKSLKDSIHFCWLALHLIEWVLEESKYKIKLVKYLKLENNCTRNNALTAIEYGQAIRALANGAKHCSIYEKPHHPTRADEKLAWE